MWGVRVGLLGDENIKGNHQTQKIIFSSTSQDPHGRVLVKVEMQFRLEVPLLQNKIWEGGAYNGT